jgi:hypothetical protein
VRSHLVTRFRLDGRSTPLKRSLGWIRDLVTQAPLKQKFHSGFQHLAQTSPLVTLLPFYLHAANTRDAPLARPVPAARWKARESTPGSRVFAANDADSPPCWLSGMQAPNSTFDASNYVDPDGIIPRNADTYAFFVASSISPCTEGFMMPNSNPSLGDFPEPTRRRNKKKKRFNSNREQNRELPGAVFKPSDYGDFQIAADKG